MPLGKSNRKRKLEKGSKGINVLEVPAYYKNCYVALERIDQKMISSKNLSKGEGEDSDGESSSNNSSGDSDSDSSCSSGSVTSVTSNSDTSCKSIDGSSDLETEIGSEKKSRTRKKRKDVVLVITGTAEEVRAKQEAGPSRMVQQTSTSSKLTMSRKGKVPRELRNRIRVEYDKVVYEKRNCLRKAAKQSWIRNLNKVEEEIKEESNAWKNNKSSHCRWKGEVKFDRAKEEMPTSENASITVPRRKKNKDKSKQFVPIHVINDVTHLPRMREWSSIRQNVFADDEKALHNLPYIDDRKKSEKFINELVEDYDGKVHTDRDSDYVDDECLLDMVKTVMKVEDVDLHKNGVSSSERKTRSNLKQPDTTNQLTVCKKKDDPKVTDGERQIIEPKQEVIQGGKQSGIVSRIQVPPNRIFELISKVFLKNTPPVELKKRYISIRENLEPEHSPELASNIDGPDAKLQSRELTMSSFHTLFCRRCFKYDCLLHGLKVDYIDPKMLEIKPSKVQGDYSKKPCGLSCFLNLPQVQARTNAFMAQGTETLGKSTVTNSPVEQISDGDKENDDNDRSPIIAASYLIKGFQPRDMDTWSAGDVNLFRAVHPNLYGNYCLIAKILATKTCKQVFYFAQKELAETDVKSSESPKKVHVTSPEKKTAVNKKQKLKTFQHIHKNVQSSTMNISHYIPCNHGNQPCDQYCTCIESANFCEKFCFCSSKCENRFPGCICKGQCDTKKCLCYRAARECDPDLCTTCGADQLDDDDIDHDEKPKGNCRNINCQRGLYKHLLLASSDVAGWGIFLKDGVKKGEFISEYCGEVISHDEAERRGKVYDKYKCSFLFGLNDEFAVDATRKGNKIRFANHSSSPNCYAKVLMVNGDHRIGIFAKRHIQSGEEIFFDYRYGTKEKLKYVTKPQKKEKN